MYINPFVAGILATISIEAIVTIVAALAYGTKENKEDKYSGEQ